MQTETETKPKRTKKAKDDRVTKWVKVEVDLSDARRSELALLHASLAQKLHKLEADKKVEVDKFKSQIAEVDAAIEYVLATVRSGKEEQDIEVYDQIIFAQNTVLIRRVDNDAVVRTRAISPAERQANLKGVDTAPTKQSGNGVAETKAETPAAKADERETAEGTQDDGAEPPLPAWADPSQPDPLAGTPLADGESEILESVDGTDPMTGQLADDGPHDINAQEMPADAVEGEDTEEVAEKPKRGRRKKS